jgi:hypothetical protein
MLAIVNVSPDDAPLTGRNKYEVRINGRVIATFEHDRRPDGAAQCLRDAADAVEQCRSDEREALLNALLNMVPNS